MGRDRSPFAMGMPGERWEKSIPALVVPIPGVDRHLIVIRNQDNSFKVLGLQTEHNTESLLMAAAIAHSFIEKFSKSNDNG
jgi:hypothetical protein